MIFKYYLGILPILIVIVYHNGQNTKEESFDLGRLVHSNSARLETFQGLSLDVNEIETSLTDICIPFELFRNHLVFQS